MGLATLIISLAAFFLLEWGASLTGEAGEALFFTLPILNFSLAGFSKLSDSNDRLFYNGICIAISCISIGLALVLFGGGIYSFLEGNDIMKKMPVAFKYLLYLAVTFYLTIMFPYRKYVELSKLG